MTRTDGRGPRPVSGAATGRIRAGDGVRRAQGCEHTGPTMLTRPHSFFRGLNIFTRHEQGRTVAQDVTQARALPTAAPGPMQVLLIEDDDGDALIVQELLLEVSAAVALRRARSLAEARTLLPEVKI